MTTPAPGSRSTLPMTLLTVILLTSAQVASAQSIRNPAPPLFDVTVGGGIVGGMSIGGRDANLRSNRVPTTDFRLFATESTIEPGPLVEVRLAAEVMRRVAVEGRVHFARPEFLTVISGDVESAPELAVSERLSELMATGGVRIRLDDPRRQARTMPHVTGGAGIVRQSHADGTAIARQPVLYVGGGVRHAFSVGPAGFPRSGVRADAQLFLVKSGLRSDETMSSQLAVTGGVFFSF